MGLGIYDIEQYSGSTFTNNLIYNSSYQAPVVQANIGADFYHPWSENTEVIESITSSSLNFSLGLDNRFIIPNFSKLPATSETSMLSATSDNSTGQTNFNDTTMTSFDNQDGSGKYIISDNGNTLSLYGNTWKSMPISAEITPDTVFELELKNNGAGEIIGIAFESDNKLTTSRVYKFTGSQNWSNDSYQYTDFDEYQIMTLPIGTMSIGEFDRLVFVLDEDKPGTTPAEVSFSNVRFYEPTATAQKASEPTINIGILND
jgi:hypothetical protein